MSTEATAAEIAAEIRDDWTIDPGTGRSNSSPEFVRLCAEVERLIRQDAFKLIGGRADLTAGLIMAQLAHVHHLAPRETPSRAGHDEAIRLALEFAASKAPSEEHAQPFRAALAAMDQEG